jgi:hypothetical protein
MGRGSTIGYNVQAAVEAKHSLIVATEVTNTTSDLGALGTMALQAQEALGAEKLSVVADKGYYNGKEVLLCDTIGVTAYVAKPMTSANTAQGLYGKESFKYDAPNNCYLCPAGQKLTYRFATNEKGRAIYYYRASGCKSCPLKAKWTRNKENRTITRLAAEEVQERMAERVARNPQLMRRRNPETFRGWHDQTLVRLRLLPVSGEARGEHGSQPDRAGLQPEASLQSDRSPGADRGRELKGRAALFCFLLESHPAGCAVKLFLQPAPVFSASERKKTDYGGK